MRNPFSNKRKVTFAAASLAASRLVHYGVPFLVIPIAIGYLGQEQYGVWVACTSLATMFLSFGDGGVGNAIISMVAKRRNHSDQSIRQIISNAHVLVVPFALAILCVSLVAALFLPLSEILHLDTNDEELEAKQVLIVSALAICLNFITNITFKARAGLDQIPHTSAWDAAAALFSLPVLLACVSLHLSMPWLVAAVLLAPALVKIVAIICFYYFNTDLSPRFKDVRISTSKKILSAGSTFFLITLSNALAINSDQVLISFFVGTDAVTMYFVANKVFVIPFIAANFIFAANWPEYARLAGVGDFDRIRFNYRRILFYSTAYALVVCFLLYFFFQVIVSVWIGGDMAVDPLIVLGMCVYGFLLVLTQCQATLLLSIEKLKAQRRLSLIMIAVNVPMTIILIQVYSAAGAVFATCVAYLCVFVIPYHFLIDRAFRDAFAINEAQASSAD
ncbi:MAG: oligosaccharide flippase family protein [Henriciella sp.]